MIVLGKRDDDYRIIAVSGCIPVNVTLRKWCKLDTGDRVDHPQAVVIPWSIARWDLDRDVLDLSFSLQDQDRVIVRIGGLFAAIRNTPMVFNGSDQWPMAREASEQFGRQYLRRPFNLTF